MLAMNLPFLNCDCPTLILKSCLVRPLVSNSSSEVLKFNKPLNSSIELAAFIWVFNVKGKWVTPWANVWICDKEYCVISEPYPEFNPIHYTELLASNIWPENPSAPALYDGALVDIDPVKLIKLPLSSKGIP